MGMKKRARRSADRINKLLAEREAELLSETAIDWAAMKPKLSSEEDRQTLMSAVAEATAHNETVGAVLSRLEQLGSEGMTLAKKVRDLIPT